MGKQPLWLKRYWAEQKKHPEELSNKERYDPELAKQIAKQTAEEKANQNIVIGKNEHKKDYQGKRK